MPTAISLLRLGLAVAFPLVGPVAGLVLIVLAAISDAVDGYLARRWGQVTRTGSIVDAVSDRLFLWTVLGTLVVRGVLAPWLAGLLLIRDAVLVPVAVVALVNRAWQMFESTEHPLVSRLATATLFALLIAELGLPQFAALHVVLAAAAVVCSVAAGLSYLRALRRPVGAGAATTPATGQEQS